MWSGGLWPLSCCFPTGKFSSLPTSTTMHGLSRGHEWWGQSMNVAWGITYPLLSPVNCAMGFIHLVSEWINWVVWVLHKFQGKMANADIGSTGLLPSSLSPCNHKAQTPRAPRFWTKCWNSFRFRAKCSGEYRHFPCTPCACPSTHPSRMACFLKSRSQQQHIIAQSPVYTEVHSWCWSFCGVCVVTCE